MVDGDSYVFADMHDGDQKRVAIEGDVMTITPFGRSGSRDGLLAPAAPAAPPPPPLPPLDRLPWSVAWWRRW